MESIQKITVDETKTVNELIEKRNAIKNLNIILQKDNNRKKLCEKATIENEKIEKEYQKWWDEIISKYDLNELCRERLLVDAVKGEVFFW